MIFIDVNCGADLEQKRVIKYIEANPNTKIKLMEELPPDQLYIIQNET